jgi:hypothetical protein
MGLKTSEYLAVSFIKRINIKSIKTPYGEFH